MMSRSVFSAAGLAALENIAGLASSAGLAVRWDDTHRLVAQASGLGYVSARISPARERDGVTVTAIDAAGQRRFFDGPEEQFSPAGVNLHQLHSWLVEVVRQS